MKPTIYDVAREAGVSIATVSKVINKAGRISDKTRQRVYKIMDDLNYQPSVVASALTGKRTNTLGLLIPDLANPFFAEIARSIEDRAQELGYSVVMCSTDNNTNKERKYITLLRQKSIDGFIMASGVQEEKILKELIEEKVPIALVSQEIPSLGIDSVTVDDFLGGYEVTQHLLKLGHKQIAVLAQDERSSRERVRGYRQALTDSELTVDESLILVADSITKNNDVRAGQLFDREERPTAIFACNDVLAISALQAARERGITIPNELSLVGFDNTIMARIVDPPLTSVAQPIHDMGRRVVDILVSKVEDGNAMKQRIVLMPELIIRGSTYQLNEEE
ncbi:LacI family DNA-binding transcriptional regulator [Aneurinibacillus tyrosinisolvens]|uniref:LacI family DNA-binding transcriptional regulator n=1 Tax=Aneurinibacillus tyrosinisolvens TaxID=1443435 RepID=UPI00063F4719|nr:LacI family DNA-binding transcriptional regulator [Aneurinibacillus tyrosinisolvens]